jgi:phytoene synthase
MVDGRESEAEPGIPTVVVFHAYLAGTAGAVARAAGRVIGAPEPMLDRLESLGVAYGIAGQLRNVAALAGQGRCVLPQDLLARHGLTAEAVIASPDAARLRPVLLDLAGHGRALLRAHAGALPRPLLAAALPAVLAGRDYARIGRPAGGRGLADRMAVLAAFLAGRV